MSYHNHKPINMASTNAFQSRIPSELKPSTIDPNSRRLGSTPEEHGGSQPSAAPTSFEMRTRIPNPYGMDLGMMPYQQHPPANIRDTPHGRAELVQAWDPFAVRDALAYSHQYSARWGTYGHCNATGHHHQPSTLYDFERCRDPLKLRGQRA